MPTTANLFNQQITIFALMMAGLVLSKVGILTGDARRMLSNLVIYFIMPGNILASFLVKTSPETLLGCLAIFFVSCGVQVFTSTVARLCYPGVSDEAKRVLCYGTIVSNAAFLGNPVIEGLFGAQGLLYSSVFLIPHRVMMWTVGISYLSGDHKRKGVFKKVITHPCIVAVFIGMFFMLTQIQLPAAIYNPIKHVSNCNTAMSMIIIGGILSEISPKSVVDKRIVWFCTLRLILMPLMVMCGCKLLGLESLVTGVATVLTGMPAAATTAILAAQYGCDEKFAVKVVFMSTLLSMVTIPIICMFL